MEEKKTQQMPAARAHVVDDVLQYFEYEHLPPRLRDVSRLFCELAHAIVSENPNGLPRCPQRTIALNKLLEAKDAAVRAALAKPPIAPGPQQG